MSTNVAIGKTLIIDVASSNSEGNVRLVEFG
jgi:hypothetical protein